MQSGRRLCLHVARFPAAPNGFKNKSKQEKQAVTHLVPHRDPQGPNSSVLVAAFYLLRRQPWKTTAFRIWDAVKRLLPLILFAASLGAMMTPALAHARTYGVLNAAVSFKFNIGNRILRPGHYQLVLVGPGLLALRDSPRAPCLALVRNAEL
jgi:hypothetical protein